MQEPENASVDRRDFLKKAATGAAMLVAGNTAVKAQSSGSSAVTPLETGDVSGLITESPGSDFMVDVLKTLDFEYIASNPASSFRSLQESFVNYGKNTKPEWLTAMHEESSVGMARGYFMIEGKDRKSTRLNSSHSDRSRMPSSA